jgi:dihydropteroate synthase type 2
VPVLVSPSRKSFLRALTGRDVSDIGPATLAAELYAARAGVDYIRTHNVRALADALTVERALGDRRG